MEKKVELLASVATALARYDFPVPGGPNSRMPLHGVRFPSPTHHLRQAKAILGTLRSRSGRGRTGEQVGEFDGEDHRFFQSFFGSLQPSHVAPLDIRSFHHDGTCGRHFPHVSDAASGFCFYSK